MGNVADLLYLVFAAVAVVVMIFVVRGRHRSHGRHAHEAGEQEVCEHLRPALEALLERGHRITRVGQHHPDLPLEIHLLPEFSPQGLYEELKLGDPVFVSERNVLYCKEDWCELHPKR